MSLSHFLFCMQGRIVSGLTYKEAGVDIEKGNTLVEQIKPFAKRTQIPGVLGGLGGFGGGFELPSGYTNPVLISGTDGVGTKLKLALELGIHDTIGIDLVAMCVNDIVVTGAKPLFFLDYYATSELDTKVATQVIKGIAKGCVQSGCALIGGETAEMPGMYSTGEYDLAGFSVGIVEKNNIIDGTTIQSGDQIIALGSSGPHSNGYSLIRKILSATNELDAYKQQLLTPTRIYVQSLLQLFKSVSVKGIAHITGGGLLENIPRILATGVDAQINTASWQMQEVFTALKDVGNIDTNELYRVLNCGVGMVVIVSPEDTDKTIHSLVESGEHAWLIGEIVDGTNQVILS